MQFPTLVRHTPVLADTNFSATLPTYFFHCLADYTTAMQIQTRHIAMVQSNHSTAITVQAATLLCEQNKASDGLLLHLYILRPDPVRRGHQRLVDPAQ